MGLTATASQNQFGGFLHQGAGFQAIGHQVVAQHDGEHRLAFELGAGHEEQVLRNLAAQLEGDVLHRFGGQGSAELDELHAVHFLHALQQFLLQLGFLFLHEFLYLLL